MEQRAHVMGRLSKMMLVFEFVVLAMSFSFLAMSQMQSSGTTLSQANLSDWLRSADSSSSEPAAVIESDAQSASPEFMAPMPMEGVVPFGKEEVEDPVSN